MSKKIKRGDCVIINHSDRPCTKLVAVVESVIAGNVNAIYLTLKINSKKCRGRIDEVTLLADFGIELVFANGNVSTKRIGDSIATYKDGRPRQWQEQYAETWPVRRKAMELIDVTALVKQTAVAISRTR